MAIRIAAYANGDDALVAWKPDAPIPGCLGFALYRRRNGKEEVIANRIGFESIVPPPRPGSTKPSTEWPIQRFLWSDFDAAHGDKVQYRVVPMVGTPDHLQALDNAGSDWTPPMLVSNGNPSGIEAFFNRGIVMSQRVARDLKKIGGAPAKSIKAAIADPKNATRVYLEGELGAALVAALTDAAAKNYEIYAALFELDDPQLIDCILAFKKRAHIILSNGAHKNASDDENAAARAQLQGKVDLQKDARMLSSGHLAHNKFCVFVDPTGKPVKVWTGSQNWTKTGLCTQSNNCLMIHDVEIATAYRKQWDRLVKAGNTWNAPALVTSNDQSQQFSIDGGNATLWFAPTKGMVDLAFARKLIEDAKSGILFLMFNPGPRDTSLLSAILDRVTKEPQIHVIGVINQDPSSTTTKVVNLFTGPEEQEGNQDIIQPDGLGKDVAEQWIGEMTRGQFLAKGGIGHAIVHSKVIVIDPFGDHPVVMTGSHNLGQTASGSNDENLIIVEHDAALAAAYVVNIAAIHNAYRWRFARETSAKAKQYKGLHPTADWQTPYFNVPALQRAIDFWVGASEGEAVSAPAAAKRPPHRPTHRAHATVPR